MDAGTTVIITIERHDPEPFPAMPALKFRPTVSKPAIALDVRLAVAFDGRCPAKN